MSHKPRVVHSIENPSRDRCVDVFARPDGRFGFGEYRRDAEDQRGWFAAGAVNDDAFDTADAALRAARLAVPWLRLSSKT